MFPISLVNMHTKDMPCAWIDTSVNEKRIGCNFVLTMLVMYTGPHHSIFDI